MDLSKMFYYISLSVCVAFLTFPGCIAQQEQSSCLQLLNCTSVVVSFDTSGLHVLRTVGTVSPTEVLDTMCSFVTSAHKCIEAKSKYCPHEIYMQEVAKTMDVADYICDMMNRDTMIQILSSECARNDIQRSLLVTDIQSCAETFLAGVQAVMLDRMLENEQPEPFDFCPVVDEMRVCFINRAGGRCGEKFAYFLQRLWNLAKRSKLGDNIKDCFREVETTNGAIEKYLRI